MKSFIGLTAAFTVAAALLAGCGGGGSTTSPITGTFVIDAGACPAGAPKPTGSYLAVGDVADHTTVTNPQSPCANRAFTLLSPGTAGGFTMGAFQPDPTPTFGPHRESLAGAIIKPVAFAGIALGMSTDASDMQNGPGGPAAFPAPSASVTGKVLTIDLRSLDITYGGDPNASCVTDGGLGCWNLGSRSVTGTYDPKTRRFTADWFVGESFTPAGDSLAVHLEGTVKPA